MSAEQEIVDVPMYVGSGDSEHSDRRDAGGYESDDDGPPGQHGLGQSKSSRRRRRKRKGKGPEGAASAVPGESGVVGSVQAGVDAAVIQASPTGQPASGHSGGRHGHGRNGGQQNAGQNSQQSNGQNGAGGAPGGTKRWKKKFRDRDRQRPEGGGQQGQQGFSSNGNGGGGHQQGAPIFRGPDTHQPGNSAVGFGKRKGGYGKQQNNGGGGARGFVGPMDHSYRVANGNVFDIPPATIDAYGNGGGGYGGRARAYTGDAQPIDYSQGRVIPIADGTPTKIYFFIEDLFFTAKIQETARKLGVKVGFIKNDKDQIAALTEGEEADRPGLIVFDLNNANAKPLTLIPKLKSKLKKSTSIIGFLSHLQGDLKAKAVEVGCDTVMPRSAFSQNLPNLLRRYGIEEIDEPNFNQ
jgi:hypothetical protein